MEETKNLEFSLPIPKVLLVKFFIFFIDLTKKTPSPETAPSKKEISFF
jgi:hypothetical protein